MNKNIILKLEEVSKQYRLGLIGTGTLSHDLNRWWHLARGKEDPYLKIGENNDRTSTGDSDYVWAIQDISFDVNVGEVLGIVGRNGAGKSTLLKILSRVTSPTKGVIKSKGRIASLLEVGTGFHPELTGKENIYLNGAILGMTKSEITKKLDEIIEFSGCARYVDTPVKRYSSGMKVRLAFAVAAHLEPEILVIDEVLAVGDAEFQKKAIGKMKDISSDGGRTVLFVSHNMASVKSLCNRAILLENGKMKMEGDTDEVVSYYLSGESETLNKKDFKNIYKNEIFHLKSIELKNKTKTSDEPLSENEEIELITDVSVFDNANNYHITYHLYNELGEALFSFSHSRTDVKLEGGENKVVCEFPNHFFQSGQYFLSVFLVKNRKASIFNEKDIIAFTVVDGGRDIGIYMGREPGYVKPQFEWRKTT